MKAKISIHARAVKLLDNVSMGVSGPKAVALARGDVLGVKRTSQGGPGSGLPELPIPESRRVPSTHFVRDQGIYLFFTRSAHRFDSRGLQTNAIEISFTREMSNLAKKLLRRASSQQITEKRRGRSFSND